MQKLRIVILIRILFLLISFLLANHQRVITKIYSLKGGIFSTLIRICQQQTI